MKEKKKQSSKISKLIQKINEEIYDEEIWIHQKMWKVAEVTYSYDKTQKIYGKKVMINTTLFGDLGEINPEKFSQLDDRDKIITMQNASEIVMKKLLAKRKKILKYLGDLETKKGRSKEISDIFEIEISINSLKEKINLLDYCLYGLPYELEKAGVAQHLTKAEIQEINLELSTLDEKLFGGKVIDKKEEVTMIYNFLQSQYSKHKENLTQTEQKKYEFYLEKIQPYIRENQKNRKQKTVTNTLEKYKKYKISSIHYIPGFNFFIDAIVGLKHIAYKNKYAKSISDGPEAIEFPDSQEFKELNLERIFLLNMHEVETHSVTDHNNKEIIGEIRGEGSTKKDEGLAMFMEHILKYGKQAFIQDQLTGKIIIDTELIQPSIGFIGTLMGEILSSKELLHFLKLHDKLEKMIISPIDRYNRLKRSNQDGVQHKDTSYTRGLLQLVKEVNSSILSDGQEGIAIEDLFLGKVGFHEIHKLKKIKEEREKNGRKFDLVMPVFASDAIMFVLEQKQKKAETEKKYYSKNEIIHFENFLGHLQKKYPIFDFHFLKIKNVSQKTKKNISILVKIAENSMNKNEKENLIDFLNENLKKLGEEKVARLKKYGKDFG